METTRDTAAEQFYSESCIWLGKTKIPLAAVSQAVSSGCVISYAIVYHVCHVLENFCIVLKKLPAA